VDQERFGEELRIHMDIEMLDLACDFVVVGVRDTFGENRPNVTKNMQKISIDQGSGEAYSMQDLVDMDLEDEWVAEEQGLKEEYDADWASSADAFKHNDFNGVIASHEFTLVNFFCRLVCALQAVRTHMAEG